MFLGHGQKEKVVMRGAMGRRELSVALLVFGAGISVYMILLAGPTSAQSGGGSSGGTTGQQASCSQDEELVETFTGTQD